MIPAEGLPVVPVVEPPEHQEASSGFQFVRETLHELTALQSCLTGFKEELSQLRADFEREQTSRKDDNESIRRHLNRSIADESQMRVGLESKLEAFQNLSKTWITSLGKDVMASKERLNALDGTTEQHGSALLAHEERLLGLDAAVALRCTVTDYKQLATTLAELQAEVVRDRSTAQSAENVMKLTAYRSRHSETCFGARLEIGNLSIGWTADSGFSRSVSTPGITKVIGYGAETEAPSSDDLPGSAVLKPGDVMRYPNPGVFCKELEQVEGPTALWMVLQVTSYNFLHFSHNACHKLELKGWLRTDTLNLERRFLCMLLEGKSMAVEA
eukprot:symbB.v1.2.034832.t1/scaffold4570.1/size37820/1